MASIINGLFAGRSGISSHGTAIAVIGDNISNSSTPGFKASRAEFEDLMAGGQTTGKIVGSGSQIRAVSTIFQQGTLEYTGRPLDLGIDGNGFFVVADDEGQRFYARAGNFKIDSSGNIINQKGLNVLGFPANGSGALELLNVNTISQDSVASSSIEIAGNVDAGAQVFSGEVPETTNAGDDPSGIATTYADLNRAAEYSTVVDVFDSLGASHTITFFFFHTDANTYTVRGYVNSEEVDPAGSTEAGMPRMVVNEEGQGEIELTFAGDGSRTNEPAAGSSDLAATVKWNNGSEQDSVVDVSFNPFTQFSTASNILGIAQDGKGIGTVTSLSIQTNGDIYAILSNGQSAVIGTVGLVNFANAEGLTRVGDNLLQQSPQSGEPVIGKPLSGTLGAIQAGSIELSTVDIADQFVKLITVQRGFQANSRIITTINQLLNEIIQLA